ncbi:hypothetical protein [Chryseobacterium sp. JV274]|uniref:hypothetical protein n=1 Tax=Chryseobacterium sp. JV274 TaxID=1932669 RepID=UPI000985938B|nr:hypothetical protein [Chryseobacterium sp. JV274]
MIKNNKTKKDRIGFRNTSNTNSVALKFVQSLHDAVGSELAYINFYKKKSGRYSSKYIPNISFELKKNLYNGKEGVVFLIYDEVAKTTVTSKYVKKIVEFSFFDDKYILPFLIEDLKDGLGYTNYHNEPLRKFSLTYLKVTFRLGNNEIVLHFDYDEKNDKPKLSFRGEGDEKYHLSRFSQLKKEIIKMRLENLMSGSTLINIPYINF